MEPSKQSYSQCQIGIAKVPFKVVTSGEPNFSSPESHVNHSMFFRSILLVYLAFPLLGAFASFADARTMLLGIFLMLGAIPLVISFGSGTGIRNKDQFFQLLVLSTGLTLLLSQTLVARTLLGYDINGEYYVFQQVMKTGFWHPDFAGQYNSVLTVTILPTVLSAVSAIDGIQMFKFIFPMVFSLVPLVLYRFYRKILSPEGAFLAAFLFMTNRSFYVEHIALARQEIAEVFFILLLLISVSNDPKTRNVSEMLVIIVLTAGLITAHYSLAYIYLLFLAFSMVMGKLFRGSASLTSGTNLLLSVFFTFAWYPFVANGREVLSLTAFTSAIGNGLFADFFSTQSKPIIISAALGLAGQSPLQYLNRLLYYLINIVLVLGFLVLLTKKRKTEGEKKFIPLMTASVLLLGATVTLPFFAASGLNVSRTYHLALISLSPCLIYGISELTNLLRKLTFKRPVISPSFGRLKFQKRMILAASILFLYFLFTSGWVWAATMQAPTSFVFDRDRIVAPPPGVGSVSLAQYADYYIPSGDVASALWLQSHAMGETCADAISGLHVLNSYAQIPRGNTTLFPFGCNYRGDYVYSSTLNTRYGLAVYDEANLLLTNTTEVLNGTLLYENRLYSNGGSVIYGGNYTQAPPQPLSY